MTPAISAITDRNLEAALKLETKDLLALIGELPEGKGHYAERAVRALASTAARKINVYDEVRLGGSG